MAYTKQLKLKEEMKKTLMLVSALVTMLFVSGNSSLDIFPATSAQEVNSNQQDTTVVESSENRALTAFIAADSTLLNRSVDSVKSVYDVYALVYLNIADQPRIDSVYIARPKPVVKAEDVETSDVVAEETTEEVVAAVPNKPYERVIVKWAGRNRYGKYTDQCAAHANGRLTRAGYYSQGHAYQIPARFPSVINGYKSVKIPDLSKVSSDKRYATVLNMHRQAADYVKENLDISKLVPGKYYVVNMYYSTSPYMLQFFYSARKQGTGNYGTHIGVLYYDTKHQAWIVEHNIHGHVYYDALVSILGGYSNPNKYGVTSISRVSK